MPELRKDPTIGRWVIISTERARRPGVFFDYTETAVDSQNDCPFCAGREPQTPAEIHALRQPSGPANTSGWQVRVVPSIKPFLRIEGDINRRGHGLYDVMQGVGAHEVVVETPQHIANMADLDTHQIELVLQTYALRINDLEKDPRFKYVLICKNYGVLSGGGRIRHSRSQLIATPVTPVRVKEELTVAKRYFDFHDRCVYCDMIRQETTTKSRVVLEDSHFLAITPFASRFPFEIWILPKKHSCDFVKENGQNYSFLAVILKRVLQKIKTGLNDPAYNFIFHSAPFRRNANGTQWKTITEDYHWHIEIIPRLTRVAGFEKGTGFYICSIPPEYTADYLRGVVI